MAQNCTKLYLLSDTKHNFLSLNMYRTGTGTVVGRTTGRGWEYSYNGLYGEAPPKRGIFFRLLVYERVGISLVKVYKRVGKSVIPVCKEDQKG